VLPSIRSLNFVIIFRGSGDTSLGPRRVHKRVGPRTLTRVWTHGTTFSPYSRCPSVSRSLLSPSPRMAELGKRRRTIVISDDEDDAVLPTFSSPRTIATPRSKASSSPMKTFPSSPPKTAKFWVESKHSVVLYWLTAQSPRRHRSGNLCPPSTRIRVNANRPSIVSLLPLNPLKRIPSTPLPKTEVLLF